MSIRFSSFTPYQIHTIDEAKALPEESNRPSPQVGRKWVYYDRSLKLTRMLIQLDEDDEWRLECYFNHDTGLLKMYSLNYLGWRGQESYYHFVDEQSVREDLCAFLNIDPNDDRYLDELMIQFIVESKSKWELEELVKKHITAQFHYD